MGFKVFAASMPAYSLTEEVPLGLFHKSKRPQAQKDCAPPATILIATKGKPIKNGFQVSPLTLRVFR
jgi:hypothetical protein